MKDVACGHLICSKPNCSDQLSNLSKTRQSGEQAKYGALGFITIPQRYSIQAARPQHHDTDQPENIKLPGRHPQPQERIILPLQKT